MSSVCILSPEVPQVEWTGCGSGGARGPCPRWPPVRWCPPVVPQVAPCQVVPAGRAPGGPPSGGARRPCPRWPPVRWCPRAVPQVAPPSGGARGPCPRCPPPVRWCTRAVPQVAPVRWCPPVVPQVPPPPSDGALTSGGPGRDTPGVARACCHAHDSAGSSRSRSTSSSRTSSSAVQCSTRPSVPPQTPRSRWP